MLTLASAALLHALLAVVLVQMLRFVVRVLWWRPAPQSRPPGQKRWEA